MAEESGPELPEVVLVMDSEGRIRLFGWPDGGLVVTRVTMERFLTFLVSCDALTLGESAPIEPS